VKIYKLAQSGGVPAGHVRIKTTFDMEGTRESRIIERAENTSCQTEDDAKLLQDLLEAEIPGFGEEGQVIDVGHTAEYWKDKKKTARPVEAPAGPFAEEEPTVKSPEERQRVDLGFGV